MTDILQILSPYLALLSVGTFILYGLIKIGSGTNIDLIVKLVSFIMFIFILVMIGGHMYYFSGLFEISIYI